MALKEFDKEIAGFKCKTMLHPATTGIQLKCRILKFISPAIGALKIKGLEMESFDIELGQIFQKLGLDEASNLFKDILSRTYVNGKIIDALEYDEVFAGEYEALYQIVIWVIEQNRFFGKGSIGDLLKKLPIKSTPVLPND